MHLSRKLLIFSMVISGLFILGCEDEETNKIAQAQKCLNEVSDSNYAAADACMSYLSGLNSQQANILKCSITLVGGGLTDTKIVNAFDQIDKDSSSNAEAVMIGHLGLSSMSRANEALGYCQKTGLTSLEMISSFSVVGTSLITAGGLDINNINSTNVDNAIDTCLSGACNESTVGSAAIVVSNGYCNTEGADPDLCNKVNAAIAAGGGDPAAIGEQLFNEMDIP